MSSMETVRGPERNMHTEGDQLSGDALELPEALRHGVAWKVG